MKHKDEVIVSEGAKDLIERIRFIRKNGKRINLKSGDARFPLKDSWGYLLDNRFVPDGKESISYL